MYINEDSSDTSSDVPLPFRRAHVMRKGRRIWTTSASSTATLSTVCSISDKAKLGKNVAGRDHVQAREEYKTLIDDKNDAKLVAAVGSEDHELRTLLQKRLQEFRSIQDDVIPFEGHEGQENVKISGERIIAQAAAFLQGRQEEDENSLCYLLSERFGSEVDWKLQIQKGILARRVDYGLPASELGVLRTDQQHLGVLFVWEADVAHFPATISRKLLETRKLRRAHQAVVTVLAKLLNVLEKRPRSVKLEKIDLLKVQRKRLEERLTNLELKREQQRKAEKEREQDRSVRDQRKREKQELLVWKRREEEQKKRREEGEDHVVKAALQVKQKMIMAQFLKNSSCLSHAYAARRWELSKAVVEQVVCKAAVQVTAEELETMLHHIREQSEAARDVTTLTSEMRRVAVRRIATGRGSQGGPPRRSCLVAGRKFLLFLDSNEGCFSQQQQLFYGVWTERSESVRRGRRPFGNNAPVRYECGGSKDEQRQEDEAGESLSGTDGEEMEGLDEEEGDADSFIDDQALIETREERDGVGARLLPKEVDRNRGRSNPEEMVLSTCGVFLQGRGRYKHRGEENGSRLCRYRVERVANPSCGYITVAHGLEEVEGKEEHPISVETPIKWSSKRVIANKHPREEAEAEAEQREAKRAKLSVLDLLRNASKHVLTAASREKESMSAPAASQPVPPQRSVVMELVRMVKALTEEDWERASLCIKTFGDVGVSLVNLVTKRVLLALFCSLANPNAPTSFQLEACEWLTKLLDIVPATKIGTTKLYRELLETAVVRDMLVGALGPYTGSKRSVDSNEIKEGGCATKTRTTTQELVVGLLKLISSIFRIVDRACIDDMYILSLTDFLANEESLFVCHAAETLCSAFSRGVEVSEATHRRLLMDVKRCLREMGQPCKTTVATTEQKLEHPGGHSSRTRLLFSPASCSAEIADALHRLSKKVQRQHSVTTG